MCPIKKLFVILGYNLMIGSGNCSAEVSDFVVWGFFYFPFQLQLSLINYPLISSLFALELILINQPGNAGSNHVCWNSFLLLHSQNIQKTPLFDKKNVCFIISTYVLFEFISGKQTPIDTYKRNKLCFDLIDSYKIYQRKRRKTAITKSHAFFLSLTLLTTKTSHFS